MSSLTNKYISNTYTGVLHAGGTAIPSSTKVTIYDGAGNPTDLELGRNGVGVTISGPTTITGTTTITGNETVSGTLTVGGLTTINDTLTINGTLNANSNTTVDGTLIVAGATTINDNVNVNGKVTTDSLTVGTEIYPTAPGTNGYLLYQNGSSIGFKNPANILDDIITADTYRNIHTIQVTSQGLVTNITEFEDVEDEDPNNIITATIYKNFGINDPILVEMNSENDTWSSNIDLSNYVSDGTKAIIAYLDLPGSAFSGEDVSYIIYASRNGQNSTAVPIIRVANGSDGEDDERYGGSTQFQSRISTNKTIRFRLDVEETQGGSISRSNWRLYIIAEQK